MIIVGKGSHADALWALAGPRPVTTVSAEDFGALRAAIGNEPVIVGVGCSNMPMREAVYAQLEDARCYIAKLVRADEDHAYINEGAAVFSGTALGQGVRIGRNVVVYSNCTIEHGSVVWNHAWLSPSVTLCGNVTVKEGAFLGAGAIVLPGVTIGAHAKIGAGAVIHKDVPDGATVYGPRSA